MRNRSRVLIGRGLLGTWVAIWWLGGFPRLYSKNYFDDTIPAVLLATRPRHGVFDFVNEVFFVKDSVGGIPGSEFYSPGITLLLAGLDRIGALGGFSLSVLSTFIAVVFSIFLVDFLRINGVRQLIAIPLVGLVMTGVQLTEPVYFFLSIQHMLTVLFLIALYLATNSILLQGSMRSFLPLRNLLNINFFSVGLILFARESAIPFLLVGLVFFLGRRPPSSAKAVLVAWVAPLIMSLRQIVVGSIGWRNLSHPLVDSFRDVFPSSLKLALAERGAVFMSIVVGVSVATQIALFRVRIFSQEKRSKDSSIVFPYWAFLTQRLLPIISFPLIIVLLILGPQTAHLLYLVHLPLPHFWIDSLYLDDWAGVSWARWHYLGVGVPWAIPLGVAFFLFLIVYQRQSEARWFFVVSVAIVFAFVANNAQGQVLARYSIYLVPATLLVVGLALTRLSQNSSISKGVMSLAMVLLVVGNAVGFDRQLDGSPAARNSGPDQLCSHLFFPLLTSEIGNVLRRDRWMTQDQKHGLLLREFALDLVPDADQVTCKSWPTDEHLLLLSLLGGQVSGNLQESVDALRQDYISQKTWSTEMASRSKNLVATACRQLSRKTCKGLSSLNDLVNRVD